jgi:predicted MFS family arabinose efflux permease
MFDLSLFRKPTFVGAQVLAFTISSAMFSQFLFLALYLQDVLHYSPLQAGLRFLPLSLVSFVTAPIAGQLSSRVPLRILFGVGMALVGGALLLMHGITRSSHWTTLLAGFVVGGVGVGLVNAPLAVAAVGVVEPRRAGMASGINNTFRQVGIATGIAGLGAIFQTYKGFIDGLNAILLVGAIVAFAGAVLGFALVRSADLVRAPQPSGAAA